MNKHTNIYQDPHHGGWVCEVLLYPNDPRPEWYRVGTFGSKAAAISAARTPRGGGARVNR